MRESKRTKILTAAVEVVQRDGVTSVTFDSVAAASGLTKGGLLYHFPSRDALLLAVHQHVAREWEESLVEAAGKTAEEATPEERLEAYARVTSRSVTRAELLLFLEASVNPGYAQPWRDVTDRWAPSLADAASGPAALTHFITRLAADGFWLYESLSGEPTSPELRRKVVERIAATIDKDA
ncbi:TetR family transcriptional regulator [Prauserella marina]|uniref:Regulatory protein, tetR family n=1 Tax=Prauserella marina TaxID=530584 RepID=A0A222VNW6_9PSEU|nr:TetR family transcriptional regulator [Prauserella marina]ASR35615.1 TetR family transcriptional regulator [Prauserella marina]PWV84522.1 TetR family transcriptional regulator [Prauserella marina]SDC20248.1 regulatory protein, tetR family [Prauserella marina]